MLSGFGFLQVSIVLSLPGSNEKNMYTSADAQSATGRQIFEPCKCNGSGPCQSLRGWAQDGVLLLTSAASCCFGVYTACPSGTNLFIHVGKCEQVYAACWDCALRALQGKALETAHTHQQTRCFDMLWHLSFTTSMFYHKHFFTFSIRIIL